MVNSSRSFAGNGQFWAKAKQTSACLFIVVAARQNLGPLLFNRTYWNFLRSGVNESDWLGSNLKNLRPQMRQIIRAGRFPHHRSSARASVPYDHDRSEDKSRNRSIQRAY